MHPIITDNLDAIRALAQEYGVLRLEVFGSVCTEEFDPERSDVDFLVEYPDNYDFGHWMSRLFQLERELASTLGRKVDLVTTGALKSKWFRREAAKTRMVIFDASEVAGVA